MAHQLLVVHGLPIIDASIPHSDSSGRMISPTQRRLLGNIHTHKRQTSVYPTRFEPAIPASERLLTHSLGRAATGIG